MIYTTLIAYKQHLASNIQNLSIETGYLPNIQSFPAVSTSNIRAVREHYGDNYQLRTLSASVRGYVYSYEDDSLGDTELLIRQIELYTDSFVPAYLTSLVLSYGLLSTHDETSQISEADLYTQEDESILTDDNEQLQTHNEAVVLGKKILNTQSALAILVQNRVEPSRLIEDARIISVTSDEGLLTPYGVADLELEIDYVTN